MSWFESCKHQWESIVDETMPSQIDLANELFASQGRQMVSQFDSRMCQWTRKRILILKCTLCGELGKTVETHP